MSDAGTRLPAPMALPAALRPWRAWLEWLSPEQMAAMGDLLPRLEAALGAFRGPRLRGDDEPVGIDDLRRRGPYHRLLLSEWAVADAAPDEFLRRASSGEHLFLSPRREVRKADARIVALFDTGPAQLGAPRLVQIALWILLARRADAAGLEFRWGTLAEPTELHPAESPQRLKTFLARRTLVHADAAAAMAWRKALAGDHRSHGECWRIGDTVDGAADRDGFTHRVDIRREWLGALAVTIAGPGGQRDVALPLPPTGAAAKLLRGQFAFEVTPSPVDDEAQGARLSLRQPPLIGPGGERIAVPLLDESMAMLYALPRRDGEARTGTRSMAWARGRELLCAALGTKHFAGIIADRSHLHFWNFEGFRTRVRPDNHEFQAPPGQAHWRPCVWLTGTRKPHDVYVLDGAGHLLRWRGDPARGQGKVAEHEVFEHDVLAIARADGERLVYVRYGRQRMELVMHDRFTRVDRVIGEGDAPRRPSRTWIHGSVASGARGGDVNWSGAWCIPEHGSGDEAAWMVFERRGYGNVCRQVRIPVGAKWQVFGLVQWPGSADHGLVALSPDRRRLMLIGADEQSLLYHADVPIATVGVGSDCDVVAAVTEQRRLVVVTPGGQRPMAWNGDGEVLDAD